VLRHEVAQASERAVADYLSVQGFSILGMNVRLGALELDIVAKKGPLVVIVEVRTRGPGAFQRPFESIGYEKRRTLLRAVDVLWRKKLRAMKDVTRLRIDAAAVTYEGTRTFVEYIEGAIAR
jgi:putative endonuclease